MRKNAGLKSKEEMRRALENGVVLFYESNTKYYFCGERIFDGKTPYVAENLISGEISPLCGMWSHYQLMEIEAPWEDELKNRNILCWVSDAGCEERNRIQLVESFNVERYFTLSGVPWKYATPITEEEAKQFVL